MPQIEIREIDTQDDLEPVRALFAAYGDYLSSNPSGKTSIYIRGFDQEIAGLPGPYRSPEGAILIALVDQVTTGCVAIRPLRRLHLQEEENNRFCEMKRLWVATNYRGMRLGRRLAESAIAWARASHYDAIYLDTVPEVMPGAHALYLNLGFESVERYNDNPVADIVFLRLQL